MLIYPNFYGKFKRRMMMHLASKFSITATALLPGYTRRFCGKVRKIMVYLVNISEFNKSIFIIDAKHCFFLIRTTFQHPPLFFVNNGIVFCSFVCLGVFVPLENLSLIRRRHHCRWRASKFDLCSALTAKFDLCSALMAIQQWGFFCVSHLLWHGASVYNCHLRRIVTLTPTAKR